MITESVNLKLCTGCAACVNACARDAVTMVADNDGFGYPQVDAAKCVRCKACLRVCPAMASRDSRAPVAVLAAQAREDDLRMRCASGGAFSVLASRCVADGGRVFGVVWDARAKKAVFACAETAAELIPMRDSKYVQAEVGDVYRKVRAVAATGCPVLFSGTPCQIYGLSLYLGEVPKNVVLVEVICMGVSSAQMLARLHPKAFVSEAGETTVEFRNKYKTGWLGSCLFIGPNVRLVSARHGTVESRDFYRLMAEHQCQRESCYPCPARGLKSGADVTLGDFWHVERFFPELNDDRGTSLVLLNTEKGAACFEACRAAFVVRSSDYATALSINRQLVEPLARSPLRDAYSRLFGAGLGLDEICRRLNPPKPLWRRVLGRVKRLARKAVAS